MKEKKGQEITTAEAVKELFRFFRSIGLVPYFFYLSMICTLLASFANLFGMRFLFSLVKGIVRGDFSEAGDSLGIVRHFSAYLPQSLHDGRAYFFILLSLIYTAVLMKSLFQYTAAVSVGHQIRKANVRLKARIFERYLRFGKLYFDTTPMGKVNHVLMSSANAVTDQLMSMHKLATEIFSGLVYLGIMFWISWKLTLLTLIIFPFFGIFTHRIIEAVKKSAKDQENIRKQIHTGLFNVISCIPLVKAQAAEEYELNKFNEANDEENRLLFHVQRKRHLLEPFQEMGGMTALLIVAGAASFIGEARFEQTAYVFIFFFLLRRIMPSFQVYTRMQLSIAGSADALSSVSEIFTDEGKYIVQDGELPFTGLRREIRVQNLDFSFPKRNVLFENLSVSIPKGKVTALIGPSGAGKSTLVNLLLRFYECPRRTIFIDDTDIREFKIKTLLDRVSLVSQETLLFPAALRENICYGLGGTFTEEDLREAVRKSSLQGLVDSLPAGLETFVGERGIQLSGGERQRVSIARAFLKKADIVVLDEATSSLDTKTELEIQKAMAEVMKGRTVIAIAHRLSTIRHADKIIVLENGKIQEEGAPPDLLSSKGKFWEYWHTQKFFYDDASVSRTAAPVEQ